MDRKDRMLFHQIHPLKLATDWVSAFVSLWFFWRHELLAGILILFVPSVIVTFILVSYVDLEKLRASAFGRYVSRYMTQPVQLVRFFGMFIAVLGAWYHLALAVVGGFLVIVLAWLWGVLRPAAPADPR
jgi:hypothetical protein